MQPENQRSLDRRLWRSGGMGLLNCRSGRHSRLYEESTWAKSKGPMTATCRQPSDGKRGGWSLQIGRGLGLWLPSAMTKPNRSLCRLNREYCVSDGGRYLTQCHGKIALRWHVWFSLCSGSRGMLLLLTNRVLPAMNFFVNWLKKRQFVRRDGSCHVHFEMNGAGCDRGTCFWLVAAIL